MIQFHNMSHVDYLAISDKSKDHIFIVKNNKSVRAGIIKGLQEFYITEEVSIIKEVNTLRIPLQKMVINIGGDEEVINIEPTFLY